MFDQAEKIFRVRAYYKPELARTMFLQSELLEAIGDNDGAQEMLMKATAAYSLLVPNTAKDASIGADEFKSVVMIWSR